MQPLAAITLMQSFPLDAVNNDRSPLAFANGQYILIERTAYDAAGGHQGGPRPVCRGHRHRAAGQGDGLADPRRPGPRNRFLPDVLVVADSSCAGWSRIFYDALDRNPWRLTLKASRSDHLLPDRTSGTGRRAWRSWSDIRVETSPFCSSASRVGSPLLHVPRLSPRLPGIVADRTVGRLVSSRQSRRRPDPVSSSPDVLHRQGDVARDPLRIRSRFFPIAVGTSFPTELSPTTPGRRGSQSPSPHELNLSMQIVSDF